MGTKSLPGMGHLCGCILLDGSACFCNVVEQVRSIWGLQRKSAILDLSICSSWVSCCPVCQPYYFLLERRVSGPVRKESTSFGQLFSLKFWSTSLVGGTKLVWYCQRDAHSIKERINLLRFPPVTWLGAGKHEVWVASSFGEEESSQPANIQLFYSWSLKPAHLLLITFQNSHIIVSWFIFTVYSCA